jgi:hypothetical protein
MNTTSNHLEEISQEIEGYFSLVPNITVTPGEGSPPEQYTVTYDITGACKDDSGVISTCDKHVISISLPFGFPHFPPNCLPESNTFHPDFDSSAICIGEAWDESKSVIELILFIGRLIAGQIYSTTNAFNEEAASWYATNSKQLPFDTTEFKQLKDSEAPTTDEVVDDNDEFDNIDTLDDADFDQSFSLEEEESDESTPDISMLQDMATDKRFYALIREIQTIDCDFEGRSLLESQAQGAIDISQNLFRESEELEFNGKQKEALKKLYAIEDLVSDYPSLDEAQARTKQAVELLGDWMDEESEKNEVNEETVEGPAPTSVKGSKKQPKEDVRAQKKTKRTFFEEKSGISRKGIYSAFAIGLVALGGMLVFSYFSLSTNLKKADTKYAECESLLDGDDFQKAEKACEKALDLLSDVKFVKQNTKKQLSDKINALLQSPKLKQGIAGNIMFEGQYVSTSTKERILMFKEAKKNGDIFYQQERWGEAVHSYTKALNLAKKPKGIDTTQLAEIRNKLPRAQFNGLRLAGEKALAASNWGDTADYFGKALQLAKENPNVLPNDIAQLERLSRLADFNASRDRGHFAFDRKDWETALKHYLRALNLAKRYSLADGPATASLNENIARTKIYHAIEKGKKAFTAANWDEVIAQYETAVILLKENSKLLRSINTVKSEDKLARIMLHVAIIQDKQELAQFLKDNDYKSAVDKLQEIKRTISTSKFADQADFKEILAEVTTQEEEHREKLLISEQTSYLTANFEKLFLKHYPAASGSILNSPKVEYLKNIGSNLLFRMQCTEKSGGRPLRLQMDYLYNPTNGLWKFYSEE